MKLGIPAMTGLANTVIGGPSANVVTEKRSAATTIVSTKWTKYFIIQDPLKPGYAKGQIGPIGVSFQDALGNELEKMLLVGGCAVVPDWHVGGLVSAIFTLPVVIPPSWSQTVYKNLNVDPVNNYCSLDSFMFIAGGLPEPGLAANGQRLFNQSDMSVWVTSGTAQPKIRQGYVPIEAYDGGGFGYIELCPSMPQGRELITIPQNGTINEVWVGFAPTSNLVPGVGVSLNGADVQSFANLYTDTAQWIHCYLKTPLAVKAGDILTLTYSGPCYPVRYGTDYGFDPASYISQCKPQTLVNGVWQDGVKLQSGSTSLYAGFPFYFEII